MCSFKWKETKNRKLRNKKIKLNWLKSLNQRRTLQREHTSGLRLCLAIKTRRRKGSGGRFVKPCFAASRFSTRFQLDSVIESFQTCLIVWFGFLITGIKRLNYAFIFVCLFANNQKLRTLCWRLKKVEGFTG